MEQLNIIILLIRNDEEKKLMDVLNHFEENKKTLLLSRGVYIYGNPGSGKTTFVKDILKKLNYDIVTYDAGDIRNKTVIDNNKSLMIIIKRLDKKFNLYKKVKNK